MKTKYTITADDEYWSEVGEQVYIYLTNGDCEYYTYYNPVNNEKFILIESSETIRRRLEAAVGSIPTAMVWDGYISFGIDDDKEKDRAEGLFAIFCPIIIFFVITLFACYWSFLR